MNNSLMYSTPKVPFIKDQNTTLSEFRRDVRDKLEART